MFSLNLFNLPANKLKTVVTERLILVLETDCIISKEKADPCRQPVPITRSVFVVVVVYFVLIHI